MFIGIVVTSGNDSVHMVGSRHYIGKALDFGANSSEKRAYAAFKSYVLSNKKSLKEKYKLEDIIDDIGFNDEQKQWVRELVKMDFKDLHKDFVDYNYTEKNANDIVTTMANIPQSNQTRTDLMNIAKSILGKVGYWWGGKSGAGWNGNWGTPMLVTAGGSKTSGTYQPYGLDCSGFVDWAYKTTGLGNSLNGGTTDQWENSYPIAEQDLQEGDLVFQNTPNDAGINHVGLFVGRDGDGSKIYIHCASGQGVTINGYRGFKYWRRAYVKFNGSRDATIFDLPQALEPTPTPEITPEQTPQAFNTIPDSKDEFVRIVHDIAKEDEKVTGVPASVTTAQAILESGYGKSVPKENDKYSYNLFGIKGDGTNGRVKCTTSEYNENGKYTIKDGFASYNNFLESIKHHSDFIKNNNRYATLFNTKDPETWAYGLQKCGYATDPTYGQQLVGTMKAWQLI
jgi:cell wall-associated NlpC family hydrolase